MPQPHVLMLAYHFPPVVAAASFRSLRFVKYLPEHGWTPTVVCCGDCHDATMFDPDLLRTLPEDVCVHRTCLNGKPPASLNTHPGTPPSDCLAFSQPTASDFKSQSQRASLNKPIDRLRSVLRRLKRLVLPAPNPMVRWTLEALELATSISQQSPPDAIYSTGPPHATHMVAFELKRRSKIPWVLDLRDPWARCPFSQAGSRKNKLKQQWEQQCVTHSDAVILNTNRAREEFVSHYSWLPASKFSVITNGYDPALSSTAEDMVRSASGRDTGIVRICHPGALYGLRDPEPIFAAIKLVKATGRQVIFEQIGHVDRESRFQQLLDQYGLEANVVRYPTVRHGTVLERMAASDILLLVQPGTAIQVPSKLYEMMLFRKPIVAVTGPGETADIVQTLPLGRVAAPGDVAALSHAILDAEKISPASIDQDLWREATEPYDGRVLTSDLATTLDRIMSSAPRVA